VIDGAVWHLFCTNQGKNGSEWCAMFAKIGFETRGLGCLKRLAVRQMAI